MHKLPPIAASIGKNEETTLPQPSKNLGTTWNEKQLAKAKKAVATLFEFVLIPDHVGNPRSFVAKAVELFSRYPADVMTKAAHVIPERFKRPAVSDIKDVLDELHEPILRDMERLRSQQEARLCLPPPRQERTAEEQARADQLVQEARAKLGIPLEGLAAKAQQSPPLRRGDGRHAERIAAELERRRAMNAEWAGEAEFKDWPAASDADLARTPQGQPT